MTTIKLTVSYDGTDYVGWQSQKNGVSVQDVLENALEKVVKTRVRITGSGRTDAFPTSRPTAARTSTCGR